MSQLHSAKQPCLHEQSEICSYCDSESTNLWMRGRCKLHAAKSSVRRAGKLALNWVRCKVKRLGRTESIVHGYYGKNSTDRLNIQSDSCPPDLSVGDAFIAQIPPRASERRWQLRANRLALRCGAERISEDHAASRQVYRLPWFVQHLGWQHLNPSATYQDPEREMTELGFFDYARSPRAEHCSGARDASQYPLRSADGGQAAAKGMPAFYEIQDEIRPNSTVTQTAHRPPMKLRLPERPKTLKEKVDSCHINADTLDCYHKQLSARMRQQNGREITSKQHHPDVLPYHYVPLFL